MKVTGESCTTTTKSNIKSSIDYLRYAEKIHMAHLEQLMSLAPYLQNIETFRYVDITRCFILWGVFY